MPQFLFRETDDVPSWQCKKHYTCDSLVLIVSSNGGHACPAPMQRVWAWASDSGLERSNLAGTYHPGAESGEVLFSACPSAILPALGLLARSRLAGCQSGLVCLACEVTFYVYFGFVLILSSQHCFSHRGKSKHSLHLPAPPSSARASWSIINL